MLKLFFKDLLLFIGSIFLILYEFLFYKTVYQFAPRFDFLFIFIVFFYVELLPCYLSLFVIGVIRDCVYALPLGVTSLTYIIAHTILNNSSSKMQKMYLIITLLVVYGLQWIMYSIFFGSIIRAPQLFMQLFLIFIVCLLIIVIRDLWYCMNN
ncbi:hypothetical protein LUA82_03315 [Neoehrlichia mikurensis]|uniref:Rod shape-determining protein MreD n=1 Tax=Neoehrlichia mikurensis TaxID=89586 RepID=A0A9Q9BZQ7_9RICK|nr:hypothetical protein [Neoehrlichia mikurensis]UTO55199.1 hypothetical protein LUA82_03315 [Neoehrlichia mikurensis]